MLGLLVAAWIIDWVMVSWVWPDGIARLEANLERDYRLALDWAASQSGRPGFVTRVANFFYWGIFEVTGVHEMGRVFSGDGPVSIPDNLVRLVYQRGHEQITVAMIATKIFGVRVAVLLMCVPGYALLYLIGLGDGLVQRAIRRASGGRESSSLYHRAKYVCLAISATSIAAVLLVPELPHITIVAAIVCISILMVARLQWTYHKKHL